MKTCKAWLSALLCCALLFACACAETKDEIVFTFFQMDGMRNEDIGDCTLIRFPDGQTMLVDAFTPECGDLLIAALDRLGVERIDYLMVTHMHIDHIGGMAAIIRHFDIGRLFSPGVPYSTDTYRAFQQARMEKGLTEERLERGDTLAIGDARLTVLNPLIDDKLYRQFVDDTLTVEQTNQQSLVFRIEYGAFSALLTGDIYQEQERVLLALYGDELRSTLLKLPHHGADTSGSKAFIAAVNAEYAVAMGNTATPKWLMKRYQRSGACAVYLTLLDGTVTVRADRENRVAVETRDKRDEARYPIR